MVAQETPPSEQPPDPTRPALLPPKLEQRGIFRWFFFAVFAFLLYQLLLILSLFADAIIWAVSLSLVFVPLYRYLQRRMPGGRNAVAAASTLCVLLLFMVPLLFMFGIVVQQSAQVYPTVSAWLNGLHLNGESSVTDVLPAFLQDWLEQASAYIDANPYLAQFDAEQLMLENVEAMSRSIANFGAAAARGLLLVLVNLILVLVLMYFCFRDGKRFLNWLYQVVPMPVEHTQAIALRVYQTINAVITGALLTAGAQAMLAIVGYMIAGVPLAMFFGVLTGISAMIPVVGAALIWVPISVFVFMESPGWGLFVGAWGLFLVSLIDNFLKPVLIGSQARMPILLVFCAILGGLNVYGFTGIIIGPILIAMLLAFIGIYRDYYLPGFDRKLAPVEPKSPIITTGNPHV
jgi:predicted PurR-regulated permease PerM